MKIAHYDKNTKELIGWYDKDIHTTIPTPNIEVSNEVWQESINKNANFIEDGKLIVKDFRTDTELIESNISNLKSSIQNMIDELAQSLGYDNINSIAKYLGYDNVYRLECEKLGAYTADVWVYAEAELIKVIDGTRTLPTTEEMLLEIPQYTV